MSDKTIKESYMDDYDPDWPKENNALKADEETVIRVIKDGLVIPADPVTYPATAIDKLLRNSTYGMTTFTDKAMPSTALTKPEDGSLVETILNDITLLKSRIDELEQENKLLRNRVDKVDVENEELRRRDGVLERHISELKLKFML